MGYPPVTLGALALFQWLGYSWSNRDLVRILSSGNVDGNIDAILMFITKNMFVGLSRDMS